MPDNIAVEPSGHSDRVNVATDEINGVHYPIYKMATGEDGEIVLVDTGNRMPVQLPDLTHETDVVSVLNEISRKLSILIEYESMMHKVNLEESSQ